MIRSQGSFNVMFTDLFYRSREPSLYKYIIPQIVPFRGKPIFFQASFSIDLSYSDLFYSALFSHSYHCSSTSRNLATLKTKTDFLLSDDKNIFLSLSERIFIIIQYLFFIVSRVVFVLIAIMPFSR